MLRGYRNWLLCAILVAPALHAQSLLALYESARVHDATWQVAKAQHDASIFQAERAKAGLLPSISVDVSASRSRFNGNLSASGTANALNLGLSASQPLYRPANLAEYGQGLRQAELARVQLGAAEQDLMMRVAQAYFDVLAAAEVLASLKAQEAAVGEQLAFARNNFELGTATVTDEREAQARYDMVIAQQIAQFFTAEKTAQARLDAARSRIRAEELRLSHTKVLASDTGVISARAATLGAVVQPGQELFRLIRQGRLEWRGEITTVRFLAITGGNRAWLVGTR